MPRGRVTTLNPDLATNIVAAIKAGNYLEDSANAYGIPTRTFFFWLARGRAERERLNLTPAERQQQGHPPAEREAIYLQLLQDVETARATSIVTNLALIRRAAEGGQVVRRTTRTLPDGTTETVEEYAKQQWTAAAWTLERTHWAKFGRRELLEVVDHDRDATPEVLTGDSSEEQRIVEQLSVYLEGVRDGAVIEGEMVDRRALPAEPAG